MAKNMVVEVGGGIPQFQIDHMSNPGLNINREFKEQV